MSKYKTIVVVVSLVMLCGTAWAQECPEQPEPYAKGHFILQGDIPPGLERLNGIGPPGLQKSRVKVPHGKTVMEAVAEAKRNPRVTMAEPDYYLQATLIPEDADGGYHHEIINSFDAWDITTGSEYVLIGIVDSGIDPLNWDISGWDHSDEVFVQEGKFVEGWDFFQNIPGGYETQSHGTHVAGIAAASLGNHHAMAGICGGCRVVPLKFLNGCGSGSTADAADAIYRGIEMGVDIMNHSYGSSSLSQTLFDAFTATTEAGILNTVAAGNSGRNIDTGSPYYPASFPHDNNLVVGASDAGDLRASFSNSGAVSVDMMAPGASIVSLPPPDAGTESQKPSILTVSIKSGTSMAAPMGAGVAGLMLSVNPDLTALQLKELILESVDMIPSAVDTVSGGRLNASASVWAAQDFVQTTCGNGICEVEDVLECPLNP